MRPPGQVVVITGASAGVGRATARRFAREGASVALLARGRDGLAGAAADVEAAGGHALAISVDVSSARQVFDAAEQIESELGPIDVWINNAMTTIFSRVGDIAPEEYERVTDVTYHGVVWGTQAAISRMKARNRGTIVQVGSALAYRAIPLQSAYCGAKHAARAFTDALRSELVHDRVDVHITMVHLPAVNTPQFRWCCNKMPWEAQPVPPIFQPEIMADAIFDAAHAHHREVYVGMPTVKAVVGNKVAPGWLDRHLARAAFEGQFTGQPNRRGGPTNLFAPVPGDHGAHGAFDDRARRRDLAARLTSWLGARGVRAAVAGATIAAVALATWATLRARAAEELGR